VDEKRELDVLREPRDPRIDLEAEARGYRDWVADQRDKGKKNFNFRSSWRNRLAMAEKICKERNGPLPPSHTPADLPSLEGCVPMPEELKQVFALPIGRAMP
jgi:hypothetical protein